MKNTIKTMFAIFLIALSVKSFAQQKKTETELLNFVNDSLVVDGRIQSSKFIQLMKDLNASKEDSTWIDGFVKGLGYWGFDSLTNVQGYITITASQVSDFDTEVGNNSAVVANTGNIRYPGSADADELNILDGATVTTAELNYSNGVTSNIQDQLDAKLDTTDVSDETIYASTQVDSIVTVLRSEMGSGSGITNADSVVFDTITHELLVYHLTSDSITYFTADTTIHYPCGINLFKYSEQLEVYSGGGWGQLGGLSIDADQENDLDGNTTMEKFTMTNATNSFAYNADDWLDVEASTDYTVSFDFKRGTSTGVNYSIYDRSNSSYIVELESYYSETSSEVSRVEIDFTTPAGCTDIALYIIKNMDDGTCYIGRAQIAPTGCTDYVKTTTSKATGE